MEAQEHPPWCYRRDCSLDGSRGAHWSSPVHVRSDRTGLTAEVRLAEGAVGIPYVVVILRGWAEEELPLSFDGGFARVLGRVLVKSGHEACERGYPQGVEKGWG
jgi:hypothetical protein